MNLDYLTFIETMQKLPDKEVKIYYAVGELIKEGRDISTLKISEISARAGIGKGTTYEYFQSKEELISKAMFFLMFVCVRSILEITFEEGCFKDKFYKILDYMWGNRLDHQTLQSIIEAAKGVGNQNMAGAAMHFECADEKHLILMVEALLKRFIDQGVDEGIFTETDSVYRKNVLCTQFILYIFLIQDIPGDADKKEVEDFVYNGLVNLLNLRNA
jgi:AcrR family transcriptional regulator